MMSQQGLTNQIYKYILMIGGGIQQRIKKMKEAILTQAKQRALAIVDNANQEADTQRAKIYNQQKEKIVEQFAVAHKAQKIKQKIQRSALFNGHRIQRMRVRYEFVQKLKLEVNERLKKAVLNQTVYKQLTKQLIVQGMLRLMERNLTIELKKIHIPLAQSIFTECEKSFTEIMLAETGKQMESKLTISEYILQEKDLNIIGGLYLRTHDGVIVCDNSIDSRVKLLFEQLLPTIRNSLFPKKIESKDLITL